MPPSDRSDPGGALAGVRVIDVSALAPGPFASMLLADHGAEVIAVERPGSGPIGRSFQRGKRSAVVDLKSADGVEFVARLADGADVFLEGSRPGVMERLGLGPDRLRERNPGLIYVRLSGYGQTGPYAQRAGHDINYLAVGGPLGITGTDEPVAPQNLLGDFASGSLMAVIGTLLALQARQRTGQGQVVDAAMVDGAALLSTAQLVELSRGKWRGRGGGWLSGTAPFYGVYRCRDGGWFSVGAYEPKFYAALISTLGLEVDLGRQFDRRSWPETRARIAAVFATRDRDEWEKAFREVDACAEPVSEVAELEHHPHLVERATVVRSGDRVQAAPAPRLSGTPATLRTGPREPGCDTRGLLLECGFGEPEAERLITSWAVPGA